MKTIEEFYNEAMADKELEVAVNKAHKENRLAEFLTEHGVAVQQKLLKRL